jgi:L-threonylcarbamoyladenylate synthase
MPATSRLSPDAAGLAAAAGTLRRGGLVAFPTETVYGLGADARSGEAVARVFEAKGRPSFNPLIVHVASADEAGRLARMPPAAQRLAAAFWPGPLTLVLPLRPDAGLSPLVTAGLATVGLRVPRHPAAQALLKAFGGPVAAPSANPSGRVSPTTAEHVLAGLDGRIDCVLDGGACDVGLESTILAVGPDGAVRLLRPGGLALEDIEACLGPGALAAPGPALAPGARPEAPGQLASHYAPRARLRLNAIAPREGEAWLGFGPGGPPGGATLSASGDLVEAAANLFGALHSLDGTAGTIAVAPVPEHGLGRAINDRLRRAAAPR